MKQDALTINKKIKQLDEVKEYQKYKKIVSEDKEIQELLNNIKDIQLKSKQALKNNDIALYKQYQNKLEEYKQEFNNNPILQNYFNSKDDVKKIIDSIDKIFYFE